jgi:outer membrane protein assembly factor BamB
MFVSCRLNHRIAFSVIYLALASAVASLPCPSAAQNTHLWTQSQIEEFEKGTPQGVAIESDGHLRQGPGLKNLLTTPSTFVWSVAVDKSGVAYLGTGSPATVLRVGADGKAFTLLETKDVSVQALKVGPDGELYAATLPSGKVYKLNPAATEKQTDENAAVVFDLAKAVDGKSDAANSGTGKTDGDKSDGDKSGRESRYIWDLTFDQSGRLYVATGNPAAVYRVDVSKPGPESAEQFFKSDEAHIRSLAWDAKGNLIAGSDGSGLVYRIDKNGKGYVLFEAPRREITSLAVGANGTIYAASVGDKSHNPLPPLPVQGQGMVSITIVNPQSLQAANESTSIPEGTEIYAITEAQAPRKLWASKDDIVYALDSQPNQLLALSGNRGHIYNIENDGSFADVGHLDAQQGLCLASRGDGMLIGTGNTGKLVELGAAEKHEYASDVLDAGAMARFGRIEIEPGSQRYQILTRTGNIEQPVRGWTDWEPLHDGVVASAPGRFLQWKVVLEPNGVLGSVGVNYLPVNAAPVVDELVVAPGARWTPQPPMPNQPTVNISLPSAGQSVTFDAGTSASTPLQAVKDRTAVTVRWAAHDDNGDDLIYSIFLRGDGETVWRMLKDKITEKAYSFDADLIPDGGYQVKVVASDSPSHTQADALTGEKVSDRFVVDTTPPVVTLKAELEDGGCEHKPCVREVHATFDAEDATSPIAHAEYSLDAGPWQFIAPVGEISDSKREHYVIPIAPQSFPVVFGEHLITVRVYDRYDNVGTAKAVVTVSPPK